MHVWGKIMDTIYRLYNVGYDYKAYTDLDVWKKAVEFNHSLIVA